MVDEEIDEYSSGRKIICDDDYILWLEQQMMGHSVLSSNSWQFCGSNISDEEQKRIRDIRKMFVAIDNYAKMNYIKPNDYHYPVAYNVRIHDVMYTFGYDVCFDCYYIKKNNEDTMSDCIDLDDIRRNVKTSLSERMDNTIKNMQELIEEIGTQNLDVNRCISKVLKKKGI